MLHALSPTNLVACERALFPFTDFRGGGGGGGGGGSVIFRRVLHVHVCYIYILTLLRSLHFLLPCSPTFASRKPEVR